MIRFHRFDNHRRQNRPVIIVLHRRDTFRRKITIRIILRKQLITPNSSRGVVGANIRNLLSSMLSDQPISSKRRFFKHNFNHQGRTHARANNKGGNLHRAVAKRTPDMIQPNNHNHVEHHNTTTRPTQPTTSPPSERPGLRPARQRPHQEAEATSEPATTPATTAQTKPPTSQSRPIQTKAKSATQ